MIRPKSGLAMITAAPTGAIPAEVVIARCLLSVVHARNTSSN